MNLASLILTCRRRLDDTTQPYLWPDEELIVLLNDAVEQACTRAHLIADSTTPSICQLTMADQTELVLDPRILRVDGVTTGDGVSWRKGREFHLAYGPKRLVVHAGYLVIGTVLNLLVSRLPLIAMASGEDVPEISTQHLQLVEWVVANAARTDNSERDNASRAIMAMNLFDQAFGRMKTADGLHQGFIHIPWVD